MNIENAKQLIGSMETILTLLKQELVNEVPSVPPSVTQTTTATPDTSADSGGQKALICPDCGAEMALRTNRTSGNKFWGCKKYPVCKGTRDENGLSRSEREELKYKKEEVAQTEGFSFNKAKRNPVTEVVPPVDAAAPAFGGWINPFAKR